MLIRGSELRTFRRCRQKWAWSYMDGREPKRKKGALTFGTLVHKALEIYYPPGLERGPHPATTFERLFVANAEQFDQWDEEGNRIGAMELGVEMLKGYVHKWGEDPGIEIISPEQTFKVVIKDRKGKVIATFVGMFDALARSLRTGRIFVFETKTAKSIKLVRINSSYGDQGLGYWIAANYWCRENGLLKPNEYIDGVMYNFLRKALEGDKPRDAMGRILNKPTKTRLMEELASLGITVVHPKTVDGAISTLKDHFYTDEDIGRLGDISKVQPPPLFERQELLYGPEELRSFEERLRAQALEMGQARKGELDIYKNPTNDCDWDCPFQDACEIHEMGGDYESILEMEFHKWNPYEDHELEEELKA